MIPAVFQNKGPNPAALSKSDYNWLDKTLTNTTNIILVWHVPIRTPETQLSGQWHGDNNLSIPESDALYTILDRHKDKILGIFNGHIHQPVKSSYHGIPVYICPFIGSGCHCKLVQKKDAMVIIPESCGLDSQVVSLIEGLN